MRWDIRCSVKRLGRRLWGGLLLIPCCLLSQAYAVSSSSDPSAQLDALTCSLMGFPSSGGSCDQLPADSTSSNQNLYTERSSFLDALHKTLLGPQNDRLDDFMAHLSGSRAGGFSPAFHAKLLGLMSQVATDVTSGKGNRWGASNLSLQTISNAQGLLSDLKKVFGSQSTLTEQFLSNMIGSNDPQVNVEKVMRSIYPVFRKRSTGRFEWQEGCGGGEHRFPGSVGNRVRNTCSFSQRVKYAQLLTTSCAQSWHQGPNVTSDNIGVTECGSTFPVSSGSASGLQSTAESDSNAFQVTQAGVFQGCSPTLCASPGAPGGSGIASHQTRQAQLLNGWADTCQALRNLVNHSCRDVLNGKAQQACVCLQRYLRGNSRISECVEGCAALSSGGGGDYSRRQACPPIPNGFSRGQANDETVQIANRAQGDITRITPCLQYAEQEAGRAMASEIWSNQGSSESSPESAFGSVYTLLGPDKYGDTLPNESTARTVVQQLFSDGSSMPFEFQSYLDTPSLDTNRSRQAELLIALLNGAFASGSASLVVPALPTVTGGGAHFLRNGRFISTDNQGQVLSGLSGSDDPQFKLQGGGSEVANILQAQNAALSSVQASHTQYTQSQQQSARMQILLMSMYYEMFAQRAVVEKSRQLTPQQVRRASATWRLDPTVLFSTTSSNARNDGDNTQPASTRWSFCDRASSDCSSWSAHVADFSFTELLREATRLLTDMHVMQYEIYEMQNRIQLLQALAGAANVSQVRQGVGQAEISIQQMANQIYAGKAGISPAQGVQSMPLPTAQASGGY